EFCFRCPVTANIFGRLIAMIMKDSIAHLTSQQQLDVAYVTSIIEEVVHPQMIILFGIHTDESGHLRFPREDYQFLVITQNNTEKSFVQECQILSKAAHLVKSINLEIHDIDFINKGLLSGESFWVDIITSAVILMDKG